MYFKLKNPNIRETYPAIWNACTSEVFKCTGFMDKSSGREYIAIDLKTAEDFISLLSLAKVTNEYAIGLHIEGNEITIVEETYTLGE